MPPEMIEKILMRLLLNQRAVLRQLSNYSGKPIEEHQGVYECVGETEVLIDTVNKSEEMKG